MIRLAGGFTESLNWQGDQPLKSQNPNFNFEWKKQNHKSEPLNIKQVKQHQQQHLKSIRQASWVIRMITGQPIIAWFIPFGCFSGSVFSRYNRPKVLFSAWVSAGIQSKSIKPPSQGVSGAVGLVGDLPDRFLFNLCGNCVVLLGRLVLEQLIFVLFAWFKPTWRFKFVSFCKEKSLLVF